MQRTELSPREDEKVGVAKPTDESPAVVMADDEEDLDDFDEDDFGTLPDSDEDFEEDDGDELPEEGITP